MTRSKQSKNTPSRCQVRAWEVVYDVPDGDDVTPEDMMDMMRKQQYGVYQGFGVRHNEEGHNHIHMSIITRDKINISWSKVTAYFELPGYGVPLSVPLKNKSRKFDVKLQQYYNYCVDESKHPHQEICEPYLFKWEPVALTGDGLDLNKCNIETYVMHHHKLGKTFHEMEELMGTRR